MIKNLLLNSSFGIKCCFYIIIRRCIEFNPVVGIIGIGRFHYMFRLISKIAFYP